jgi:hypothetical protein
VLEFDVQVEGDIRAVDAVALVVGTEEALLDLRRQPPVLLTVLEPVQPEVLVLQTLREQQRTSICVISSVSCDFLSEISLISAQWISF